MEGDLRRLCRSVRNQIETVNVGIVRYAPPDLVSTLDAAFNWNLDVAQLRDLQNLQTLKKT